MATASKPEKPATPMAEIEDLRNQLAKANTDLHDAQAKIVELTDKYAESVTALTGRNGELIEARKQLSESNLKLQTAESDLATEKAAHEKLKTDTEAKIQTEAAKIAAANGQGKPVAAAPAAKPGETAEAPDKTKMSGVELIAAGIKADTTR